MEKLNLYVWYGHIKDALADGRIVSFCEGDGALRAYMPLVAMMEREGKNSGILTLKHHLIEFVGLAGLEQE